ncbi:hypothetical protein F4859DRAFT_290899 [Xylaria cf. heliscus]|nr:hypothetical protein F4859DRAFT_290899 [Xylaria cf. heliscus]
MISVNSVSDSCYSSVSTTTILIAPTVSTKGLLGPISEVHARHGSIMAISQAPDPLRPPPNVTGEQPSSAKDGWAAYSTIPTTSALAERSHPSSVQGNVFTRSLSDSETLVIVVAVIACIIIIYMVLVYLQGWGFLRRNWPWNRSSGLRGFEQNEVISAGEVARARRHNRDSEASRAAHSHAPIVGGSQHEGGRTTIELNDMAPRPLNLHRSRGRENMVSPA